MHPRMLCVCVVVFVVGVVCAAPLALTPTDALPFMCDTLHAQDSQAAIQTSACTSRDCYLEYTVRSRDISTPLSSVNWTTSTELSTASSNVTCRECSEALDLLAFMCRSRAHQHTPTAFATACATLRPHDGNMFHKCKAVYETVSSMFCPRDPCDEVAHSLQFSPNAICESASLDCGRTRTATPPEKPFYDHPPFQPLHRIPPLSCIEYITRFQTVCTSNAPQWKACSGLDGFKLSGCEWIARRLLLVSSLGGDICSPLLLSSLNSTQHTQPQPTLLDASDVCTLTLLLPDHSALPFDEYLEYRDNQVRTATPTPTATPNVLLEVAPTPTATAEPKGERGCVEGNTPTPTPEAIVRLWPKPLGYHVRMENRKLITFGCAATSTWTDVRPKLGCHFTPFHMPYAGFGETHTHHPCMCTCSGHVKDCSEGTPIYWSDVSSPETCAQMMCGHHHFGSCAWEGVTVASDAFWNGDNVKFTSIVLQETCQGASATVHDLCGTVITAASLSRVSPLMTWTLKSQTGLPLTSDKGRDESTTSDISVSSIWLPCGLYSVELLDSSFQGNGWSRAALTLKDNNGYSVLKWDAPSSQDPHRVEMSFEISEGMLQASRVGLCDRCQTDPLPCKVPVTDTSLPEVCFPFVTGTTDCPPNTVRCN